MPSSQTIYGIVVTLTLNVALTTENAPGIFGIGSLAGLALMASGETAAAKTALDESIGLKPTPRALLARANLAFAQGEALGKQDDWDAAEPYFRAALAGTVAGIELARFTQNLAKYFVAHRFRRLDRTTAAAYRTGFAQRVLQTLTCAFARHFHEAERRNVAHL